MNTAAENAAKLSVPVAPPNVPHARLMNLISALSTGLSAAGTSLATHGREGGEPQVAAEQRAAQESKIQAQQAQQAQRNAQIQSQISIFDTNAKLANSYQMLGTMHNAMTKSDLEVSGEQQRQAGEQQTQAIQGAEFSKANWGLTPDQVSGKSPLTQQNVSTSQSMLNRAVGSDQIGALAILGKDNPAVIEAQRVAKLPTPTAQEISAAGQGLVVAQQQLAATTDAKTKQQAAAETAPLGAKADQINAMTAQRYQVLNPGQPLPDAYKLTPQSTPKDFDRVDKTMQQTESAAGTKANRDVVNGMRDQMLELARGAAIPGDETKTGADYMATLPAGLQGTVKSIGEGRAAPPPAGSRSAAAQTILGALNRAYPDYDATKYPSYLDARKKFTSGPEAKGINAINTVETHLAKMYDHANAAFTSGGITGRLTGFLGDKNVIALGVDRTAVATELSKAYAAGQISEGEVKDWETKLDINSVGMTTGKLITNLKEIDGLLEGKQKAYEQQWSTASPSASIVSPVPIISPDAAAARAKIRGEQAPAASAAAPAGATPAATGPDPFAQFGGRKHPQ
jgi:hypothetical protein